MRLPQPVASVASRMQDAAAMKTTIALRRRAKAIAGSSRITNDACIPELADCGAKGREGWRSVASGVCIVTVKLATAPPGGMKEGLIDEVGLSASLGRERDGARHRRAQHRDGEAIGRRAALRNALRGRARGRQRGVRGRATRAPAVAELLGRSLRRRSKLR